MTKEEAYEALSKSIKARNEHIEKHHQQNCYGGSHCNILRELNRVWTEANDAYTPFADADLEHNFHLHLVDVVWGEAHEDQSVPSTEWAERMIAKAKDTFC